MLRTSVLTFLALAVSPAIAADWATAMFKVTSHDFGTVAKDSKAEFEFEFANPYVEEVRIVGAKPSCGCTSVSIKQGELKTYERGAVVAKINTDRFLGQRGATITVTVDKPFPATVLLNVKANIVGDVVFNPGSVDLGNVDRGTPAVKEVTVQYLGGAGLQITGARTFNPHLGAELVPAGQAMGQAYYRLRVRLGEQAPLGYIRDNVILTTNDPYRPQITVAVEGRVQPEVLAGPSSLFLGVLEQGGKTTRPVAVYGKRPFRIVDISADGGGVVFNAPDAQEPRTVHKIEVTFVGEEVGRLVRTIRIKTDLSDEMPQVVSYAVVQPRPSLALQQ